MDTLDYKPLTSSEASVELCTFNMSFAYNHRTVINEELRQLQSMAQRRSRNVHLF